MSQGENSTGQLTLLLVCSKWPERALIRAALLEHGLEVLAALDIHRALVRLEEESVDLVVVDLPCQGQEALETLRARRPQLPLVLLSGPLTPATPVSQEGMMRVLQRPFRIRNLICVVEDMLKSHEKGRKTDGP